MFGADSLLLMVVCCLGLAQATNQHLICKSVHEIFSPAENTLRPNRGDSQGAPGKRGAPGLMGPEGPNGPQGPPGIVDYGRVNRTIDEKLQTVINNFSRMENLVTQLTSKVENLTQMTSLQMQGFCDIHFNNSCFKAILHTSSDITQSVAESICNNFGARVADVYDEDHYNLLLPYLRTKLPTNAQYCFRLGLTYDYSTNVARRQSGAESFARWHPGLPGRSSSYNTIYIWVHHDKTSTSQGFYNYISSYTCQGVVCELQGV